VWLLHACNPRFRRLRPACITLQSPL
jgi:hypothetical protein